MSDTDSQLKEYIIYTNLLSHNVTLVPPFCFICRVVVIVVVVCSVPPDYLQHSKIAYSLL